MAEYDDKLTTDRLSKAGVKTAGLKTEQLTVLGKLSDAEIKDLVSIQKKIDAEKLKKAAGDIGGGIIF